MDKSRVRVITPVCPAGEKSSAEDTEPGWDMARAWEFAIEYVPENDWVLSLDADTTQTTRIRWYRLMEKCVELKPDAGVFLAQTNRLWAEKSSWQMCDPKLKLEWERDIIRHFQYGHECMKKYWIDRPDAIPVLEDVTWIDDPIQHPEGHRNGLDWKPMSAMAACIKKSTFTAIGGPPPVRQCDYECHRKIRDLGMKIWLVKPLYVAHFSSYMREFGIPPI